MPRLTINGQEIEVAPGTTVIRAALELDQNVPHYCWHPALSVVASCRICQVEVMGPGPRRLATACNLEAVDGMVVETETPAVAKARAGNLEMLLLNHPLDCPICDKAGECWLQDYAYEYGAAAGRNDFERRSLEKRVDISEHVLLDQERCILCTRCVRFLDEYAGKAELVVTARGERSVLETFPGQKVSSEYQGNLADICPVGALTLKDFRFKNRVWYLRGTDSVCPSCSRGCSITLDVRKNELNRVRPRTNEAVNGWFICDVGRFGLLERYHPEGRFTEVRIGAEKATLAAAAERAAGFLRDAAAGGGVLVLASRDQTNEELWLLQRLFHGARAELAFRAVETGRGDGILQTGEKAGNVAGLRMLGYRELDGAALPRAAAAAGAILVLDDALGEADRRALAAADAPLVVLGVTAPLAADAEVAIPAATVGEKEGTLTNLDRRVQRVRPGLRHPPGVPGEWNALLAIGAALGVTGLPATSSAAFHALAEAAGLPEQTLAAFPAEGLVFPAAVKELQS